MVGEMVGVSILGQTFPTIFFLPSIRRVKNHLQKKRTSSKICEAIGLVDVSPCELPKSGRLLALSGQNARKHSCRFFCQGRFFHLVDIWIYASCMFGPGTRDSSSDPVPVCRLTGLRFDILDCATSCFKTLQDLQVHGQKDFG